MERPGDAVGGVVGESRERGWAAVRPCAVDDDTCRADERRSWTSTQICARGCQRHARRASRPHSLTASCNSFSYSANVPILPSIAHWLGYAAQPRFRLVTPVSARAGVFRATSTSNPGPSSSWMGWGCRRGAVQPEQAFFFPLSFPQAPTLPAAPQSGCAGVVSAAGGRKVRETEGLGNSLPAGRRPSMSHTAPPAQHSQQLQQLQQLQRLARVAGRGCGMAQGRSPDQSGAAPHPDINPLA